jgi:opacity protein-like surface antigen
MLKPGWIAVCAVVLLALGGLAPGGASAQAQVGVKAVGIEAGLPLVLGLDASYRVNPHWRVGIGLARLSGFTALRGEARWLFRTEARGAFVPCLFAGAEQYFLNKDGRDATPVGVHVGLGVDYFLTESPVSFGIRLGGLKTFGSSGAGELKVFSVRNGYRTGTFNMGVRYHF